MYSAWSFRDSKSSVLSLQKSTMTHCEQPFQCHCASCSVDFQPTQMLTPRPWLIRCYTHHTCQGLTIPLVKYNCRSTWFQTSRASDPTPRLVPNGSGWEPTQATNEGVKYFHQYWVLSPGNGKSETMNFQWPLVGAADGIATPVPDFLVTCVLWFLLEAHQLRAQDTKKGLTKKSYYACMSRPLPWWVLHGRGCVLH